MGRMVRCFGSLHVAVTGRTASRAIADRRPGRGRSCAPLTPGRAANPSPSSCRRSLCVGRRPAPGAIRPDPRDPRLAVLCAVRSVWRIESREPRAESWQSVANHCVDSVPTPSPCAETARSRIFADPTGRSLSTAPLPTSVLATRFRSGTDETDATDRSARRSGFQAPVRELTGDPAAADRAPRSRQVALPARPRAVAVVRCAWGADRRREQSVPIRVIRGSPFCVRCAVCGASRAESQELAERGESLR